METTRHFTVTVYVVHDGETALHEHPSLGILAPPGGHIDRDELPHEAAVREVEEETGLTPTLLAGSVDVDIPAGRGLPEPAHLMCYDVNVHADGAVGHQHVDHVYYATVPRRAFDPAEDEEPADAWRWFGPADLADPAVQADAERFGTEAIEAADGD